jgi:hypothetical protein
MEKRQFGSGADDAKIGNDFKKRPAGSLPRQQKTEGGDGFGNTVWILLDVDMTWMGWIMVRSVVWV